MNKIPNELILYIYNFIDIHDIFITISLNKNFLKGQTKYFNYIFNRIKTWSKNYNLNNFYSINYYNNKVKFLINIFINCYEKNSIGCDTRYITFKYNSIVEKEKCVNFNVCENMTYSLKIRETFKPYCSKCRIKNFN